MHRYHQAVEIGGHTITGSIATGRMTVEQLARIAWLMTQLGAVVRIDHVTDVIADAARLTDERHAQRAQIARELDEVGRLLGLDGRPRYRRLLTGAALVAHSDQLRAAMTDPDRCQHCGSPRPAHERYTAVCPDGSGTTWAPATAGDTTTKEI